MWALRSAIQKSPLYPLPSLRPKSPATGGKKGKAARIWALSGGQKDAANLDFSEAGDDKAPRRPEFVPDTSVRVTSGGWNG